MKKNLGVVFFALIFLFAGTTSAQKSIGAQRLRSHAKPGAYNDDPNIGGPCTIIGDCDPWCIPLVGCLGQRTFAFYTTTAYINRISSFKG